MKQGNKDLHEKTMAVTSRAAIQQPAPDDPGGGAAAAPGMSSPPPAPVSPVASPKGAASAAGAVSDPAAAPALSPRSSKSPHAKPPGGDMVTPAVTIEGLKARREIIINNLNTIRATLFKNNELVGETQGIPDRTDPYDVHWLTYRPRGVPYDVLTYRGREKALDLLRCFDRDHDDRLDFSDFRGYLEHFNRTEEYGYLLDNRESWVSYMHDLFDTDAEGQVTPQGFLMHRQEVERRHPLSKDLEELGLDALTATARQFRNACLAFDRLDVECQKSSMDRLLRGGGLGSFKPCGKVPIQQLQLLLGDCGESLSVQRGRELMLYHSDHQRVMASLLAKFARKDLTRKHVPPAELEDTGNVYKRGFWAWFMSGRPRQETRWLERQLIWCKNRLKRGVRSATRTCDFLWKHTLNGIKRGVITSQVFLSHKQETARYEGGIRVGKAESLGGGMLWTLRFQQLESERAARKKTGMPASAGMAFTLDLLLKSGVEPPHVALAVSTLKKVIAEHLETEIMKLPRFLSWQVFPTVSDIDSLKVIRISINLKNDMHVDNLLKHLQLGFSVRDLFTDLSLEARTNLDLRTVCDDKTYVLDEKLGVRVELKATFCRGLVASLLREVLLCMHDVHHERRASEDFDYRAEQQAKERTLEDHPDHTTRFLRETFKYHHPNRPAIEETVGELEASEVRDPEAEALLDFELYNTWGRRLLIVQRYLHMVKAATWDLAFESMGEALFGTAFMRALLPRWVTRDLVSKPGALAEAIKKLRTTILHEIDRARRVLDEHDKKAEDEARKEEEDLGEAGMKRKQLEKEKADMVKRLQAISLKASGAGPARRSSKPPAKSKDDEDGDDEDDKSRAGVLRRLKKRGFKTHKAMIDCYRALAVAVMGPHSMHLTSGRYRVYVHCEGLEVWDTFIPVPRDHRPERAGKKGKKTHHH